MHKPQFFTRSAAFVAFVAMAAISCWAADKEGADGTKERQLIAVLKSDAAPAEKAITCKQLAVYGTKQAVPALAPLLADERLASWARIALEAIPGPEAAAALRDAVPVLKGRRLVGVINSIGVRGDAGAVDALAGRLKDADTEVASAAAVALGRIGNDSATALLRKSLADAPAAVRSSVAEGCILCAERCLADGMNSKAAEIYEQVRKADLPTQRKLEATRGEILARKAEGIPLLVEQLRSEDKKFFNIGLSTARELGGQDVTDALAAELARLTPQRGALLLNVLASRGDTISSPVVLQSAKSGSKQVRIAAIGVLGRLGDASCVPTLLDIALVSDAELSQAARTALAEVPDKEADAAIAARLDKADGQLLGLLIELAGQRRIDAAPALIKAIDHSDAKIRAAALTALGETIGPDDLSVLIARVASPKNAEEIEVAHKALRAACIRMPDGERCAGQLVAAMTGKPATTKSRFLEVLGAMGGKKSLQALGTAAKDSDPLLQDTSSRLLGQWMTVDAGPVLLDVAKTAPEKKYQVRALRGYIRLARQFNMPNPQRAEMCDKALAAATRPDEQKLVLQVIERYPSLDMLRVAAKASKESAVKQDAMRVAIAVAQKVGGKDAQKLLTEAGQKPVKLEIIKATYGAGAKQKDVTALVRRHARGLPLIALSSPSYNTAFGGDPAQGVKKQLRIEYQMDGKKGEATFNEDATIVLPVPK